MILIKKKKRYNTIKCRGKIECHHLKKLKRKIIQKIPLQNTVKKLHEKTGRNIIVYYSGWLTIDNERISIDSFDKNGFMNVIKDLDKTRS